MSHDSPIKIAVLPGDGIGIDVIDAACPIFDVLSLPMELTFGEIGWSCWQRDGDPVPSKTWDLIKNSTVTLLGAITSMPKREAEQALPKHLQANNLAYVSPIIQLRQHLDLYANLRPCFNVKGEAKAFNFSVVRENTEGLYSGFDYHPMPKGIHELLEKNATWQGKDPTKISVSLRLQSEFGLYRLFEFAFQHAVACDFSRVTFADKPNVLRQSAAFAREIFESVAAHYPSITADILNVDAVALWMVRRPEAFGVIVAENMFGDILSDLGAGVMGGLGFAPSANIGEKGAYFEPVHGSAPNVERGKANPSAMFLTIAMLLEHLKFTKEAHQIRRGVTSVLKAGRVLTYDLGGKATTQEMAKAIIDATVRNNPKKTISFLITGSELLNGDFQESNAYVASKMIDEAGGDVRAKMLVSDNTRDISQQLLHLLNDNDAVITIGGLGPTSDDNTRFAIRDSLALPLELDETSWTHIQKRLNKFGLHVTESNQQQALFPKTATIWTNECGTANACHLRWQGRDIFMLPGPPKEFLPLFEHNVMPYLTQTHYFKCRKVYRYLTLGLIEGEISTQVDTISEKYGLSTAYCWHYPYLEIKLIADQESREVEEAMAEIEILLRTHIVSTDGTDAEENLTKCLTTFSQHIHVQTPSVAQAILNKYTSPHLSFVEHPTANVEASTLAMQFDVLWPSEEKNDKKVVRFNVCGTKEGKVIFQHQLQTPERETDIDRYIQSYFAWQLSLFINLLITGDRDE